MEKESKKKNVQKKEQVKTSNKKEKKESINVSSKKKKEEKIDINQTIIEESTNNEEIKEDNLKKQKIVKIFGIIIVGIAFLILLTISSNGYGGNAIQYEFTNINIDEYLTMLNSEEKLIVYVARLGCSWCSKETPIIKKIASKNDLTIYYLDTSNFYDNVNEVYTEEGEKFINSSERYEGGYGTPNTIIVQNGEIIDGIFNYASEKEIKKLFKNHGFIE